MATLETDVIIVGGGPIGLFMAAELSFWGISCVVIEKRTEASNSVRAVLINSNTMEHMRRLGLEKALMDGSYPRNQPVAASVNTALLGEKALLTTQFAPWGDSVDGLGEKEMMFGFTRAETAIPPVICPQYTQERVLKAHLETKSNVKLMFGKMATSVKDGGNEVTVSIIDVEDMITKTLVKGKYLIACDGARSGVRKQLKVHNFGQFVVRRGCTFVVNSPETTRQLQETGSLGLFGLITKRHLSVFSIALNTKGDFALHAVHPSSTSNDTMHSMCVNANEHVRLIIGKDVPFTVKEAQYYNVHALIATKYREGRVFFAGDAAHQWIPAGGLGLNTGYQDACDLGWKMAAVINGWGGPKLLDSFQIERRSVADKTRRFAVSIAPPYLNSIAKKMVLTVVIKSPLLRFLVHFFVNNTARVQFAVSKYYVLGHQYTDSNIIMHEYDSDGVILKNPEVRGKFFQSSLPGSRAPHVAIPESASIHDIFGMGFVLLIIGGLETDCAALQMLLKSRKVPFKVCAYPKFPELVSLYNCKYYLVRPDGIIAWRSHSQPSNYHSDIIVKTICGDLPSRQVVRKTPPKCEPTSSFSFLINVGYGVLAGMLAKKYTGVSNIGTIGIGLGVATLTTVYCSKKPARTFAQKISRHQAWQITDFGPADSVLQLDCNSMRDFGPRDVLIRVHAASINPIDVHIRNGYSSCVLHKLVKKANGDFLPAILGRDCAGEVVAVGDDTHKFVPGDLVYAACPVSDLGTHAQYACINEDYVSLKPVNIDDREAASLPWVATTAWTAVVEEGGLTEENTRCKQVLVHGGSGGVGSFAIQMFKSWGAEVTTTCSADSVQFVHSLGADKAIVYTEEDFSNALSKCSYDFVLDTVGLTKNYENPSLSLLKMYDGAKYVSLISPRLAFLSKFGSFFGEFLFQWYYRFKIIINRIFGGRGFYYSCNRHGSQALDKVKEMVEMGNIQPCLAAVYSMDEMVAAHKHFESGSPRGKVVVSFK